MIDAFLLLLLLLRIIIILLLLLFISSCFVDEKAWNGWMVTAVLRRPESTTMYPYQAVVTLPGGSDTTCLILYICVLESEPCA